MNMKAYRVMTVIAAVAMLLTGKAMAGGAYGIIWDNDASQQGNFPGWIYTSTAATTLLPAGDLIQLVAVQGGSNYVLSASTIGQNAATLVTAGDPANGAFSLTSAIASNVLQGAVGSPLGVVVYGGLTTSANSILIVPNGGYAATVPSPDWATPPSSSVVLELDATTAPVPTVTGQGGITSAEGFDGNVGFYVASVPEPSSIALVVMGLLGGFGMMRRRS
jgi:hypothetical protein